MHPVANIRGSLSTHLQGRKVVLAVCGSIAAVKCVELARELIRHGADVHAVMSESATRILHPDAMHFATGNPVVTRLSGAVEHVGWLGAVPDRADLLLVAPATANTVSKMALGIDDGPVTTCATVAFGGGTPVLVAPAMHEVMLDHPVVADHVRTLRDRLGVAWVEPVRDEAKAKLADVEAIAEEAIHLLATKGREPGPLAGRRCLVVSGGTAEPFDEVRVLSNRTSGLTGILLATELYRLGADVALWQGHGTTPVPSHLEPCTVRFGTQAQLLELVAATPLEGFHQVWMPAAIGDYAPEPFAGKLASGQEGLSLRLRPLPKVVDRIRGRAPDAVLVAFKAEATEDGLEKAARAGMKRHGADFVVANSAASFASPDTRALLVAAKGATWLEGRKADVLREVVAIVTEATDTAPAGRTRKPAARPAGLRAAAAKADAGPAPAAGTPAPAADAGDGPGSASSARRWGAWRKPKARRGT
ncbi:MAG TPA: bifunctional phosphopantothenoylcysteine decarboxylase/phosphopantothenate--cysteine ligase CoaBC [Candidatus Thermoplasmatota archaeon]|nr:bifunctional phosphopantothenoylcysteine decarboxylase/phosphopantothenate--cysteine ligase CoaBC [Candidatus Thermoplasmatota archaeon]